MDSSDRPSPAGPSERAPEAPSTRAHRVALAAMGIAGLVGVAGASSRVVWMLVVAASVPALAGAVVLASMEARRPPVDPWLRIGYGLVGVTLANLTAWQTFRGPAMVWAPVGVYLTVGASGLLLCTGVVGLADGPSSDARRARRHIDAVAVVASTSYAWWMLTHEELVRLHTGAESALLLLGPMAGAVTVGIALHTWSRPIATHGPAARSLAAGVALMGVGSGLGTWLWAIERHTLAIWLAGIQLVGATVCCGAALGATRGRPIRPAPAPRWGALVTPLSLTVALGVGGGVLLVDQRITVDGLAGFVTLTIVALVRQGMALAENQQLARSLSHSVDRLRHQATHDPVTGLPNRSHLQELIAERGRAATLTAHGPDDAVPLDRSVALVLVNLDRFQHVNDTLGHARGDTLLRVCADRIRGVASPTDVLAHLGSDEFALWRVGPADEATMADLATAIAAALRNPVDLGGLDVVITASIGIAVTERGDHPDEVIPTVALQHADLALRAAKQRGRNRIETFDPSMSSAVRRRISLAAELRRALSREEFEIYYQPLVGFADGRVVGAEALVRWNHPDRGVLTPEHFLDVAEEIGVLTAIGRQSLAESCRRFAVLNRQLVDQPVHLALNQSAAELHAPDVVEFTARTLSDAGLDPSLLILEVSEEILADRDTVAVLEALHDLGVQLSIDDFGTGYSSLRQLRRFPADEVKIDRSFVTNVVDDDADRTVTAAVCHLGAGLGLRVVAEGVETEAQAEVLRELGCDVAQGWLYGRPQPFSRLVTDITRAQRLQREAADSDEGAQIS